MPRSVEGTAVIKHSTTTCLASPYLVFVALGIIGGISAAITPIALAQVEHLPPLDEVLEVDDTPIKVEAEPTPDYAWYQPAHYFSPEIWDGSIEVGVNGATGNTESFNISAGYDLKRETERWILSSDLKYYNSSQNSVITQNYSIFNAGVEWKSLGNWTAFTRSQIQFNEFQPWDLRLVLNGGLGYSIVDTKPSKLKLRFGAGASRDFGGGNEEWTPEALFGMDAQQRVSDRHKFVAKMDYYPAWDNFSDYRLVSDASWQILLDETTNLSLKLGVVTNYDSTPPTGSVPQDVNYVALLMWKL